MQGLLKGVEHEARMFRSRYAPAHDATGIGIDHEGDINEACPGADIGEVGDPDPISVLGRGIVGSHDPTGMAQRDPVLLS